MSTTIEECAPDYLAPYCCDCAGDRPPCDTPCDTLRDMPEDEGGMPSAETVRLYTAYTK